MPSSIQDRHLGGSGHIERGDLAYVCIHSCIDIVFGTEVDLLDQDRSLVFEDVLSGKDGQHLAKREAFAKHKARRLAVLCAYTYALPMLVTRHLVRA